MNSLLNERFLEMSRERRDEEKREMNIERNRARREAAANKRRTTSGKTPPNHPTIINRSTPPSNQLAVKKNIETPSPQDEFNNKLSSVKTELISLTYKTRTLPEKINTLDSNIKQISTRVQNLRDNKYYSQSNLEKRYTELENTWNNISPSIQSYSLEQSNQLLQKQTSLETKINQASSITELIQYTSILSDLNRDLLGIENNLSNQIENFQSQYHMIDSNLRTAEDTVANLVDSSIGWKNNEHPLLAVNVHDLTHNKKGVLTLTNLRILFEEIKEEVIRKTLFIATEKKTVHELMLDEPIGSIDQIEKGTVGLFKGAGLFIKFKPQAKLAELKIDTDRNEDDLILHYYNHIILGEADKELEPVQEKIDKNIPIVCPTCSAPYREEILRGQTSVKCIYCGTVIQV